jgi:hypothetical protein
MMQLLLLFKNPEFVEKLKSSYFHISIWNFENPRKWQPVNPVNLDVTFRRSF